MNDKADNTIIMVRGTAKYAFEPCPRKNLIGCTSGNPKRGYAPIKRSRHYKRFERWEEVPARFPAGRRHEQPFPEVGLA